MEFTKKVYSTRYDSSVPVYVGNDSTGADEYRKRCGQRQ